jgi:plasmid stability protein
MPDRKNLKVRAALHLRLKLWATATNRGVEDLADELLTRGLDGMIGRHEEALDQAVAQILATVDKRKKD